MYQHITFRIYQLGKILGLNKFDPFTLACYHGIIMSIYVINIIDLSVLKMSIEKDFEYFLSILIALGIILANYFLIKHIGFKSLLEKFEAKSRSIKFVFDILMIVYIVFAFVL